MATVLVAFAERRSSPAPCTSAGNESSVPPPASEFTAPAPTAEAARIAPSDRVIPSDKVIARRTYRRFARLPRASREPLLDPARRPRRGDSPSAAHLEGRRERVAPAHLCLVRGPELPLVLLRAGDERRRALDAGRGA